MSERVARDWIRVVESEAAQEVRACDIYPRLRSWSAGRGHVLEVGAGQGICSESIVSDDYTGMEPSQILIARACERYPQRRFVLGSAEAIPFADAAFDSVFSVAVWHLLPELNGPAREVRRVLRPGGGFLLITANPDAYPFWTGLYTDPRVVGLRFEGTVTHTDGTTSRESLYLYRREEIVGSLATAGLKILRLDTFRQDRFLAIQGERE